MKDYKPSQKTSILIQKKSIILDQIERHKTIERIMRLCKISIERTRSLGE